MRRRTPAHRGPGAPRRVPAISWPGLIGLVLVAGVVAFSYVGPLLYHSNELAGNIAATNLPPGPGHPLGTDANGYDLLGRLMLGGRTTLEVGAAVALLATAFGVVWGVVAGYFGHLVDAVMMRVVDVALALPALFVLVYLASVTRPTTGLVIVVLAALSWLVPARLVRGETLKLRGREFVDAAAAMGAGPARLMARHLVPNAAPTIIVNATFQLADAMVALATLSFLGFGLPPPSVNWGGMLSAGTTYLPDGYWWEVYPAGIALMATVIGVNLVAEALRAALEGRVTATQRRRP